MKTFTRTTLALLAVAGIFAGVAVAEARLPQTETLILEHSANDKTYGDVLADQLDGSVSQTVTYGGVFASSNNTIIVTAKRATRARGVVTGTSTYASVAVPFYLGTTNCQSVTATAADSLTIGSNGGYVPTVTGKAGWLLLNSNGTATLKIRKAPTQSYYGCTVLPNGRVTAGAVFSF